MKVINFYAGPGTGKSTVAAYTFAKLKEAGVNAEYVQEYPKDLTWSEHYAALACQPYVSGKQYWRLERLRKHVDVAVTDGPLLHSLLYLNRDDNDWYEAQKQATLAEYESFINVDIFLIRETSIHPYNAKGRTQSLEESQKLDELTLDLIKSYTKSHWELQMDYLDNLTKPLSNIFIHSGIKELRY